MLNFQISCVLFCPLRVYSERVCVDRNILTNVLEFHVVLLLLLLFLSLSLYLSIFLSVFFFIFNFFLLLSIDLYTTKYLHLIHNKTEHKNLYIQVDAN